MAIQRSEMKLTQDEWVQRAATKLQPYMGGNSLAGAEILYKTYVVDDRNDLGPDDAVAKDMSYWN